MKGRARMTQGVEFLNELNMKMNYMHNMSIQIHVMHKLSYMAKFKLI